MTRLVLSAFRSYDRLRLEVEPTPVVLCGANGAGKTNLLEALSFLAPGRGLRRARLADVAHRGDARGSGEDRGTVAPAPGWAVATTVATRNGPVEVGTGLDNASAGHHMEGADDREHRDDTVRPAGRRVVKIDGETSRGQAALAQIGHIAWLTPDMDRLFVDAASGRRRFLDRLVYGFAPDHARRLSGYERALRERNRLLRCGRGDAAWLDALEISIAENGIAVAAARRDMLVRLERATDLAVGGFPRPSIRIDGPVEGWLADASALEAEDRLRAALAQSRRLDAETGRTAHGPHRSDFRVVHRDRDMSAEQCSTGEQKALLVALVLAAARLHRLTGDAPPILLLDEIAAHLDGDRRAALFDEIAALGAQAWMTGTDAAFFDAMRGRAQFLTVADSAVTAAA